MTAAAASGSLAPVDRLRRRLRVSGIVQGVGFLGAGVMMARDGIVVGVTSAARIRPELRL